MEHLIAKFTEHCRTKGRAKRGIEELARTARYYVRYLQERNITSLETTLRDAELYREHLRMAGDGETAYAAGTVNARLSYLRSFYAFLAAEGIVMTNPFDEVEKLKETSRIPKNILSVEEIDALLKKLPLDTADDVRLAVMLELLYSTGIRVNELESLRREDIHETRGYIVVHDTKSRTERKAPLTEYAALLLSEYLNSVDFPRDAFVFKRGKERTLNRWINDRLKRICAKEKLPLITCHGLRHTFATHLLRHGADIREVQEMLGHAKIRNTEVYTRIFPDDLQDVIADAHPREAAHLKRRAL